MCGYTAQQCIPQELTLRGHTSMIHRDTDLIRANNFVVRSCGLARRLEHSPVSIRRSLDKIIEHSNTADMLLYRREVACCIAIVELYTPTLLRILYTLSALLHCGLLAPSSYCRSNNSATTTWNLPSITCSASSLPATLLNNSSH